jgi:N6-L-threonylcarbamoyladenine synthase
MSNTQAILGLESSCDDTAAAIVVGVPGGSAEIRASVVFEQADLHAAFGGVVPEIAARAHAEKLDLAVCQALREAGMELPQIDAIAVTAGPGLIGGVMSGVMCAKGLAASLEKPLYGVNHLAGHALTPRLTDDVRYPYLMLLVSGGHCQFLIAHGPNRFERLGGTIDDAPGEAFDKVARLIALPQPGGPHVERAALNGDARRFDFPRPLVGKADCNLSFSGLKTAVLRARDALVVEQGGLYRQDQADIAASFQAAVADVLAKKTARALDIYMALNPPEPCLCVAGGVAANKALGTRLKELCAQSEMRFVAPPLKLCTDNAAMIAFAALEQMPHRAPDGLDLAARPRWPLDQSKAPMIGSGRKGAKA